MAVQLSVAIRNARLDVIESTIGVSAVLKIRTLAPPSDVSQADVGTVLATLNLPADWMNAASGGTKTLLGTWTDASADASGTAGHFRIYQGNGTTQHMQGSVGQGTGDLPLDNTNIAVGQVVNITVFTLTAGNG